MKKMTLMAALMLISLQPKLYAQTEMEKRMNMSKMEQTFGTGIVTVRDFVTLNQGKMILELVRIDDYEAFKNLDSILLVFMRDIAFYKDSLSADPTAHYRIDYVLNDQYSFKKIRFKKYRSDGEIFMNRDGEIAKLKFGQDTVRIVVQSLAPGLGSRKNAPCTIAYNAQATFILGNYNDVEKIVADKVLFKIMDTLEKETRSRRTTKNHIVTEPTTIVYNPYYNGKEALRKYKRLMGNEYAAGFTPDKITFNPQIGAALVRNTIVPITDIGIQLNTGYWNDYKDYTLIRLSATGYYFFDRTADGKHIVNDNWFVNLTAGNVTDRHSDWVGKKMDFGIGYLFSAKGGYFKNTTFRAFTDIVFTKGITIVPELIFTNDFKQIFPGITIKVF